MDIDSSGMDKTNIIWMPSKPSEHRLLHGKVPGDYFFLELAERPKGPLAIALGGWGHGIILLRFCNCMKKENFETQKTFSNSKQEVQA